MQSFTWLHFKGNYKCGAHDGSCCDHILGGNTFQTTATQKEFEISSFYNCNTRYVVYLIICELYHIQYVGRTTRRLRDRFYEHVYSVQKNKTTNVARHFRGFHAGYTSAMKVQVIEKIRTPERGGDIFRTLCHKAVFWIFLLQTRIPSGLNFEWDVSHYYN